MSSARLLLLRGTTSPRFYAKFKFIGTAEITKQLNCKLAHNRANEMWEIIRYVVLRMFLCLFSPFISWNARHTPTCHIIPIALNVKSSNVHRSYIQTPTILLYQRYLRNILNCCRSAAPYSVSLSALEFLSDRWRPRVGPQYQYNKRFSNMNIPRYVLPTPSTPSYRPVVACLLEFCDCITLCQVYLLWTWNVARF